MTAGFKLSQQFFQLYFRNLCTNLITHQVVSIHVGSDANENDILEVVDIDDKRICGVLKRSALSEILLCVWRKPSQDEVVASAKTKNSQRIDFMTG